MIINIDSIRIKIYIIIIIIILSNTSITGKELSNIKSIRFETSAINRIYYIHIDIYTFLTFQHVDKRNIRISDKVQRSSAFENRHLRPERSGSDLQNRDPRNRRLFRYESAIFHERRRSLILDVDGGSRPLSFFSPAGRNQSDAVEVWYSLACDYRCAVSNVRSLLCKRCESRCIEILKFSKRC